MRIGKIASSAEYRMDELFQNCRFLEPNFDFSNWNNFEISSFSNLDNFKHQVQKIRTIFNLGNSKNVQFGKFKKIQFGNFQKFLICKIETNFNFENFKNLQCDKFEKFAFSKI